QIPKGDGPTLQAATRPIATSQSCRRRDKPGTEAQMTGHARDWIDVLQALLTPTIALAAVGIGLAQWWIARNKLKLDLFDRRWGVYIAARDLLSEIFTHGKSSDEAERRLLQGIRGVRWLFDERVEAYLTNELWAKATLLRVANSA